MDMLSYCFVFLTHICPIFDNYLWNNHQSEVKREAYVYQENEETENLPDQAELISICKIVQKLEKFETNWDTYQSLKEDTLYKAQ